MIANPFLPGRGSRSFTDSCPRGSHRFVTLRFGAGFVDLPTTFKLGGILGVVNLLIWGIVGGTWWKIIGLY